MMPSNNNYAAWVYGSLQWNAARFCSTERLASDPNPLRWDVCLWPAADFCFRDVVAADCRLRVGTGRPWLLRAGPSPSA